MIKFVINIFRNKTSENNQDIQLKNIFKDIVDNSSVSNPIVKYHEKCSWYDNGKPYRSFERNGSRIASTKLLCTAKSIMKECKLMSLNITHNWSSLGKCKVEFDLNEYKKVYMHNKFPDIRTEIISIKDKYENISNLEIRLIEDSYRDTFKTINEIFKESNYYVEQDEYSLIMEIINQFNKDIEIGREDSKKSRIERLRMEVEYLNKIKETRQMFGKMSNT